MDTVDYSQLLAECTRLEGVLLANEKALNALDAVPDCQDERARLTAQAAAHLAELRVVNTKLSALREPA
ncbi:hypothetical protein [Azohydromonas australica]|uniref:hypothetical protein n=1 Tax=Azohydromonas australica TaxID=364039 RepID=UPI000401D5AA|nr:hypothetical protein [Azohydromonas australica]